MATQKQILSVIREDAQGLGALVTVRKNLYGEYEARVRMNGERDYVLSYFADDFEDAVQTVLDTLGKIEARQRAEGDRRVKAYAAELQTAIDHAQAILNLVGCRLEVDAQDTVTFYSPKTGSHSLAMRFGVRPVSDLLIHAIGFAEQQTHVKLHHYSKCLLAQGCKACTTDASYKAVGFAQNQKQYGAPKGTEVVFDKVIGR